MLDLIAIRHDLHRHPEVSGHEQHTSQRLQEVLSGLKPTSLHANLGGHGIVARFEGRDPGPALLLRADMDALPLQESPGRDHGSRFEGRAHLCGHDGHMAMLLGLADLLSEQPPASGSVDLLFQPAEETGAGALAVMQDAWFNRQRYDMAFALHNLPGFPLGQVVLKDGLFASASRGLILRLKGITSHASQPEEGNSPAMALAQLIAQCSALPQFSCSFGQAVKVTVIHARLGQPAFGSSPGEAELMLTLRSHDTDVMEWITTDCLRLSHKAAEAWGLELEHEWTDDFPGTRNDPAAMDQLRSALQTSALEMRTLDQPFPWSDDFGQILAGTPGVFFGLGSGENCPALHHPDYDFPDDLTATGVRIWEALVRHICNS